MFCSTNADMKRYLRVIGALPAHDDLHNRCLRASLEHFFKSKACGGVGGVGESNQGNGLAGKSRLNYSRTLQETVSVYYNLGAV